MNDLKKLDALSLDLLEVVKPYLPVLARSGPDIYDGFIKALINKKWNTIDKLLYEKMTSKERKALEKEVLSGLRAAAQAKFERIQLGKEIGMKLVIRILMLSVLG